MGNTCGLGFFQLSFKIDYRRLDWCSLPLICFYLPRVLFTLVLLLYTFATGYRSQFVQLVSLQPLIPHLNKLGLLSREEQQELTNPHHTEDRRIRKLLDIVAGKGPEGYTLLKDALREEITHSGHGTLSGILYDVPRGRYCHPPFPDKANNSPVMWLRKLYASYSAVHVYLKLSDNYSPCRGAY